jgi:hypothetical protein
VEAGNQNLTNADSDNIFPNDKEIMFEKFPFVKHRLLYINRIYFLIFNNSLINWFEISLLRAGINYFNNYY